MDRQEEGKVPVESSEAAGVEDQHSTVSTDPASTSSFEIPDVGFEVEISQLAAAADAVSWTGDEEAPALTREAAVGRVQKGGARSSTPNTSLENVIQWWEERKYTGVVENDNIDISDISEEAICGSSDQAVEDEADCSCGGPPVDHSSDYDSLPDPHPVQPEPEDVIEDLIEYVLDQVIYQVAQHEDFILDCNVTLHSSGPWENLEDMVHLADAVVEQEQEAVEQQPIAEPLPEAVEQPIVT